MMEHFSSLFILYLNVHRYDLWGTEIMAFCSVICWNPNMQPCGFCVHCQHQQPHRERCRHRPTHRHDLCTSPTLHRSSNQAVLICYNKAPSGPYYINPCDVIPKQRRFLCADPLKGDAGRSTRSPSHSDFVWNQSNHSWEEVIADGGTEGPPLTAFLSSFVSKMITESLFAPTSKLYSFCRSSCSLLRLQCRFKHRVLFKTLLRMQEKITYLLEMPDKTRFVFLP